MSAPLIAADAHENEPQASGVPPDAFKKAPLGLPPVPSPERNPPTPEKIALGAKLFSDPRLSIDGTMSCASCHDPKQAFTNPNPPRRAGIADTRLRRDVSSLLNAGFAKPLHHDGSEPSLEVQILAPLFNPAEMGNTTFDDLTQRLAAIPEYREGFLVVFGAPLSIETLGHALASFERSLIAHGSPFDRWQEGMLSENGSERPSISITAEAGFALFRGKAGCGVCHHTAEPAVNMFTNNEFINTGIGFQSEARRAAETPNAPADRGREEVTHSHEDCYKFRVATLRNVELTAPYMHDGSLKTLEDVVAYYNAGGFPDPEKDSRIKPLGLTEAEQKQLIAFLKSLTSEKMPGFEGRAP